MSNKDCQKLSIDPMIELVPEKVCATSTSTVCGGDSGGPLVVSKAKAKARGQLNSKCLFWCHRFDQKTNKNIVSFYSFLGASWRFLINYITY